MADMST